VRKDTVYADARLELRHDNQVLKFNKLVRLYPLIFAWEKTLSRHGKASLYGRAYKAMVKAREMNAPRDVVVFCRGQWLTMQDIFNAVGAIAGHVKTNPLPVSKDGSVL